MKKLIFNLLTATFFISAQLFAQEGTKQLMPNANDKLYIEFNVFDDNNFGMYNCPENERINIYLEAGEKLYLGMKMNTERYSGDVWTNYRYRSFRIKDPSGAVVLPERMMVNSGDPGYIDNYSEAVTGPNGAILNGSTISGGYEPIIYTASTTGNHYIEFESWWYTYGTSGNYSYRDRWALQFFDATVTDATNQVITNPGEANKSAGRLWSYKWQLCNTSFNEYPVNAHFFVFTEDEFVNKVNFKMYPYSFIFLANHFGVTTYTEENYIRRTQSMEGDQTGSDDVAEYRIFLNDPDRNVWPNTLIAPPRVQVWAEEVMFMDYNYDRNPLYTDLDYSAVILEKNRSDCPHDDITFFKIEANMDGFTAILIDIDGDGEYSFGGSDRVIYRELKKGLNYILWDFKTDNGALVANGEYTASATFFGRGPAHFPLYDVEQMDGIITSAIRPFNKLTTTIYWDDSQITNWGDMNGGDLMDETQQKQLKVENHVPRTWMYRDDWANVNHNGEVNTMNTWFNAIDLGYSDIGLVVQESDTKCVNGQSPWVGDVYIEGPLNNNIVFNREDFDYKFFHPSEESLSSIEIQTLPSEGTLWYNGSEITTGDEIAASNIGLIEFQPPADFHGQTSFEWKGRDPMGQWSNNKENVYLIINTPPAISSIEDQFMCTNSNTTPINFTVNDNETPAEDLEVTAFSAFPDLVPHSGIVIGGTGTDRSVSVTPVPNKSGKAIVYVMVDDGFSQVIEEFAVTVSPNLEFNGDTIVCLGDDLWLMAEEVGADSYEWKYGETVVSTERVLEQPAPVYVGEWSLTITKTIDDGGTGITCESTRFFQVEVAPLTSFSGDTDVCIGEEISLTATEVNAAEYIWRKDGNVVYEGRTFTIQSASLSDAGTYSLYVDKAGCTNTSEPFTITVVEEPNSALPVTGNTIDPGKTGVITIGNSQTGVTYNVYDLEYSLINSGFGSGTDLDILISYNNLSIGDNKFLIGVDNGNCEIELSDTGLIHVNTPGVTVSVISGNTSEDATQSSFMVNLDTEPYEIVVVSLSSNNEGEGTVSPSSLNFTPTNYDTPQTITVTGVDDDIIDGPIEYSIITQTTSSDTLYNEIETDDVTVINEDNDVAGVSVNPITGLTTTEASGTDNFTVVLDCQPATEVTIDLSSSDTTEGLITFVSRGTVNENLNTATITFDDTNWNNPVTVMVSGQDDDIDDDEQIYYINTSLTLSIGDPNFDGLPVDNVEILNSDNDNAGIIVNPTSGLETTEDGGNDTFTIVLKSEPTATVTIGFSSSDNTEGAVLPSSITFDDSSWSTPQTITVSGLDDNIDDDDVAYNIITDAASSDDLKYSGLNPDNVSVTNIDNDVAGITITPLTGLITTEDGGVATFNVHLDTEPVSDITISITSNLITEGTVSPKTLIFSSEDYSEQTVTITGEDDVIIDGDVEYTVTVEATGGDSKYTSLSPLTVSVTNNDNDVAGLELSKTSLSTSETGTSESFEVRLTAQPASNVSFVITGLDETEGFISITTLDFTPANWNVYQNVSVTGKDDAEQDGNQTYNLTIGYDSGDTDFSAVSETVSVENADDDVAGVSVSPSSRVLNITEGSAAGIFTISLNTQPATGTTVTFNFSSPDENEITLSSETAVFTHDSWNLVSVDVQAVDDSIDDNDQSYFLNLGSAISDDTNYNGMSAGDITVNVTDIHTAGISLSSPSGNTTEDGGTAIFTVVLNSKPTANVNIISASQDSGEGKVTSGGTLTFTPDNWDTEQTVTVTGQNDDIDDGLQEYQVLVQVSGSDPVYESSLNQTVTLYNEDNDASGVSVSPVSGLETTEDGGTAEFNIVLESEPTHNVEILVSSNDASEGTLSPASITFTALNWDQPQTITITGVDDDVDDGDQPYTVSIISSSTDNNYNGVEISDVSVTNFDNDKAGVTVLPISGLETTEAGGSATFNLVLDSEPTHNVEITINSNDASEGTLSPASITFTALNWDQPQTITIAGVDDDVDDGDQPYTVSISSSSTDNNYNSVEISNVSVTNLDNDEAGVSVSPASGLETTEDGGTAEFNIELESEPTHNVEIAVSSNDASEGTVSPVSIIFTALNWDQPQTITIAGVNDDVDDGDQPYTVSISSSSPDNNYNSVEISNVSVTNLDNDDAGFTVFPTAGLYTKEDGTSKEFTVCLNSKPVDDIVITLNSDDESEGIIDKSELTFTSENWRAEQTVIINGVDDDVDDGDISYYIITQPDLNTADDNYRNLDPADVSITNQDDDSWGFTVSPQSLTVYENQGDEIFTIVLNSEPTANVRIDLTSDDPGRATITPMSIEFIPSEWNQSDTITVSPIINDIDDGNAALTINTARAVSGDGNYDNKNPANVAVTIINDDEAGISVSNISGNTSEDITSATFSIVLDSEPTDNVTIDISSSNTDEGTASLSSILFNASNWDAPQTITVTGVDDAVADGNQTYYIQFDTVMSNDDNYSGIELDDIEVVNVDNDSPGVTVFPISGLTTYESGETAEFFVKLNSEPTADVTVQISSSDESEGTVSANEIVFSNANWSTEQSITITGIDDLVPDGDQSYTIDMVASSDDNDYDVIEVPNAGVTNMDDWDPRPVDDAITTDQETPVIIRVLDNDSGLDYQPVAVTIHSQPQYGSVEANDDNTITYTPDRYYYGDFSFEYTVCNNIDNCANASVVVTVERVDVTPVANDDSRGTAINTAVEVDVLFNDENLYDIPVVVSVVSGGEPHGTIVVNEDNTLTYTPATDYTGYATFYYRVTDNDGDFDEALVTINVQDENHMPNAVDDNAETDEDKNVAVNVLANDTGLEDGFGSLQIYDYPDNGTVTIVDRIINYLPNAEFTGYDEFIYLIEDIDGDFDIATVTVFVKEIPGYIPVAVDDAEATEYETVININVLENDLYLNDGVQSVSISSTPVNGTCIVEDNFTVTYTPNTGFSGTEVFKYQVCDNDGDCATASVTIQVLEEGVPNYIPVAVGDNVETFINTSVDINVLNNDSGLNDGFGAIKIQSQPLHGSVVVNSNRTVTYTPSNWYIGSDQFIYLLEDIHGDKDTALVNVTVIDKPNYIPVAHDDYCGTEYETLVNIDVLSNDTELIDGGISVTLE
ncbi:MAG TPA: Ig-like domain-containing protein, partial [Bacteroidales bacterium]|nr:Ig-like domain-containing protein [Bacteroidales bacterium]